MVIFVTTEGKMYKKQEIIKDLTTKFKEIKSIIQNINIRETNAILGNKNFKMYGTGFIMDKLGELKIKISPLSFYQVNPIQMKNYMIQQLILLSLQGMKLFMIYILELVLFL